MNSHPQSTALRGLAKVPEATALFWATKLLTTGFGEAGGDWFSGVFRSAGGPGGAGGGPHGPGPGPGQAGVSTDQLVPLGVSAVILAVTLVIQFSVRRYLPWAYWLNVVAVSVFGTVGADVLHQATGWSTALTTGLFTAVLLVIFAAWFGAERTLSIHSITTRRREAFYWLAVVCTFALGTAAGDWATDSLGMDNLQAGFAFAGVILLSGAVFRRFRTPAVAIGTFWFAYVFTRPVGASFADWAQYRGLNWGNANTALISGAAIVLLVAWQSVQHGRTAFRPSRVAVEQA
ncbi:hypothetical protein [Streptomyces sp. NPDC047061]|uniref:COG4705 family protein n=1 Tax=Streptomyces sp. NPDC047061 TaxID=3154605 RepID=UPI0033D1EEC5